jgi:glutamate synthase domain-containing protein 3
VVVILGPVGANFGAGMTGGRAYLYDPEGRHLPALDARSVIGTRLSAVIATGDDGVAAFSGELRDLLVDHRAAGSTLAAPLLADGGTLEGDFWLVEPTGTRSGTRDAGAPAAASAEPNIPTAADPRLPVATAR